jgi:exopolysaccharide biosynthesis polyprenyl glycosylphosphotransferase
MSQRGPLNTRYETVPASGVVDDRAFTIASDRTLEILERRGRSLPLRRRSWLVHRMLLVADTAALVLAFLLAQLLLGPEAVVDRVSTHAEFFVFFLALPLWVLVAKAYGLYDHDQERTDHATVDDFVGVFHMVTVGTWLFFGGTWLSGLARPDVGRLFAFWILATVLVTLARACARAFARRNVAYIQNAVIVGAGDVGQLLGRKLRQHPEYGINLVGFVDTEPKERHEDLGDVVLLGPPEHLAEMIRLFDIERVVFAFSKERHEDVLDLIRTLSDLDVQVDIVPRLFEIVGRGAGVHGVEGLPLLGLPRLRLSPASRRAKRTVDVILAGLGLILLSPILALIAVRIKMESPGPVFFKQVRMGQRDKVFEIYKFRTMFEDADVRKHEVAHLNMHARPGGDPRMFKVPDDPRTTPFGSFLRRYSLDELPQLINVIRGEMTLVGPRPLILDEDRFVPNWARKRLDLKPGVTGLWQVLGRSEIPFEEMTRLDYLYITSWSLWTDMAILFRTLPAVLRSRRAY